MARQFKPFKLTPTQKLRIQESSATLDFLESEVLRMEDAGLDTKAHREKLAKFRAQSEGILRVYGN